MHHKRIFFSNAVWVPRRGGVGCVEASFAILETITSLNECVKYLVVFSTFVKPFKQFGLMVLIQIVHSTWNQREVVAMNL